MDYTESYCVHTKYSSPPPSLLKPKSNYSLLKLCKKENPMQLVHRLCNNINMFMNWSRYNGLQSLQIRLFSLLRSVNFSFVKLDLSTDVITFSSAFSIYQSKHHQFWYVDLNFYHQAKYCLFMGASPDSGFLNLICWQRSQAYENPSDDQA